MGHSRLRDDHFDNEGKGGYDDRIEPYDKRIEDYQTWTSPEEKSTIERYDQKILKKNRTSHGGYPEKVNDVLKAPKMKEKGTVIKQ